MGVQCYACGEYINEDEYEAYEGLCFECSLEYNWDAENDCDDGGDWDE